MKKVSFLLLACIATTALLYAQQVPPAPADKAVVYFVRVSSLGFAINFSYFDSTRLIAKGNGTNYVRYECQPGSHLFWARSENKDFIEAELEAGKIYFIEVQPQMGGLKAAVQLYPVTPDNEKKMKKILKLMEKKSPESFSSEELSKEETEMQEIIRRGIEKYKEDKEKGKKIEQLEKTMFYTPSSTPDM